MVVGAWVLAMAGVGVVAFVCALLVGKLASNAQGTPRTNEPPLIMARLDRSRPARMALALFGLVGAGILGVILGVVREAGWLSLIFALAFALALLLEIAGGWQETTRRSRRRLLQAFSLVLGVIIFAVVAYREGWEAVLFLLIFLAIWQLATIEGGR
jgi:dipeptide/tripeptide permease